MRTFTDTFLSTVDRFSAHLGPITTLMDSVLERIAPQATAAACSGCYLGQYQQACGTNGYRTVYEYGYSTSTGCFWQCNVYGSCLS